MKIKYLILSLAPLLVITIINIITYFSSFLFTVLLGDVNVLDTDTATVDQGIFNVLRYTLSLIVFGWWLLKIHDINMPNEKDALKASLKKAFHPGILIIFIILGVAIQAGTDAILYILGTYFTTTFASYKHMMETFIGSRSPLFIITVVTIGPMAEELIFRGLTLHYAANVFTPSTRKKSAGKNTSEKDSHTKSSSTEASLSTTDISIWAVVFQAALFGIYHGNLIQLVYAFIFGMLFGIIAAKAHSIIPSTIIHVIVNGSLYFISETIFVSIPIAITVAVLSVMVIFSFTYIIVRYYDVGVKS